MQSIQDNVPPETMPITLGIIPPLPAETSPISSRDELSSVDIFTLLLLRNGDSSKHFKLHAKPPCDAKTGPTESQPAILPSSLPPSPTRIIALFIAAVVYTF